MPEALHQHLAAKKEVEGAYAKLRAETFKVFKSDKLDGLTKEYKPFDDEGQKVPPEHKEIVTTVMDRLGWFRDKAAVPLIDFRATSDATNCAAKAHLEFGGVDFGLLPPTFLLALEKMLEELRTVYDAIPTRDLTKVWEATERGNVCKHGPVDSYKNAKKTTAVVLYDATKEHPAQIKEVVEEVQVGRFQTTYFTGAVSPQQKADWLGRIDALSVAVKKARMKANETEIILEEVGAKIFVAIHNETGNVPG